VHLAPGRGPDNLGVRVNCTVLIVATPPVTTRAGTPPAVHLLGSAPDSSSTGVRAQPY